MPSKLVRINTPFRERFAALSVHKNALKGRFVHSEDAKNAALSAFRNYIFLLGIIGGFQSTKSGTLFGYLPYKFRNQRNYTPASHMRNCGRERWGRIKKILTKLT